LTTSRVGSLHLRELFHLWVPNWSSTLCDLGIFVDQSPEPIALPRLVVLIGEDAEGPKVCLWICAMPPFKKRFGLG